LKKHPIIIITVSTAFTRNFVFFTCQIQLLITFGAW